ncbi:GH92 family glycosyl hydrolase [Luteibacter sp. CQ10]|uniref:GH92 family glycosyl hydrolase n=1 Tax=Luteibacter sp. CQ10 TaxID=2805821 RepID=UPI0034A22C46
MHSKVSIARPALAVALTLVVTMSALPASAADHVSEVDPFIGSDWFGDVFVGATTPFGMVKLGPDVFGYGYRKGFKSTGEIRGFSHLHLSGGSGKYDNIRVMPVTGEVRPGDFHSPRANEQASPGYYAVDLPGYGVHAELTATRRTGVHRYTFSRTGDAHITLDLDLLVPGKGEESQKFLGADLKVVSPTEVVGVAHYAGGWNEGGRYDVYFDMMTDTPAGGTRTWLGGKLGTDRDVHAAGPTPVGVSFDYKVEAGQAIQAKVGISFVSLDQARRNARGEVRDFRFNDVRQAAVAAWNRALARIEVAGGDVAQRRTFYTALYHTMMMPSDHTGENPKWTSSEPYYDDFQAIWDTFRSQGPLLTLIAPDRQRDIVRSLVDTYRHAGYMPDARVGNDNGRTQGGSNADVLVADAFVKGLSGIDYKAAFEAMLKDATVPPADARKEGRGGLDTYNTLGYVALPTERAGSRTVEYAYDDFTIAEVACGLGRPEQAALYTRHAGNWTNLWDAGDEHEGVKGFLRPRNADGSWAPQYLVRRGTWPDFYYEGDLWTYSIYAPQDVRRLVEMSGGKEAFVKRLDTTFDNLHFDITNEPGFLVPDLYLWAGRPDRTADRVTTFLERAFNDTKGGIPGNDDSGAMSSWYAFQSMGFYPNPGQDVYLIGTPAFADSAVDLGGGRIFRVHAEHFTPDHTNRYVQSATLDGQRLDTAWFRHGQIARGGQLTLVMGPTPSSWGTVMPPPSMSDPGFTLCSRSSR